MIFKHFCLVTMGNMTFRKIDLSLDDKDTSYPYLNYCNILMIKSYFQKNKKNLAEIKFTRKRVESR